MRLCKLAGWVTGALLAGSFSALSADVGSTGAGTQPGTAAPGARVTAAGATRVEDSLASQFAIFAGSQDNARSLVTGLRQGSEITLATSSEGGQAGTSTTFTPPTRPMGYGNVRISLALAQEQLIRLGITRPTADQLQAALVGGAVATGSGPTATELQGVLQMRAQGMGWGQIANAMGTKLGHVMSGLKQTNQQLATGRAVPGAGAAGSAGITTAAGNGSAATSARGSGRGPQARIGGEAGIGIVTAAGGPAATSARVQASSGARGAGVVTGAGVATGAGMSGSRASLAGQMNGKGHAKP